MEFDMKLATVLEFEHSVNPASGAPPVSGLRRITSKASLSEPTSYLNGFAS